ncbi:MAG: flagellar assembly protein FliH [Cellvibrio sp.]|uniref:flagellar assembly protein FliH n=1 Tax=Cellvibrio sp. TaxID=1965322 RepID=UPI0031AFFFD2
MTVKVISAKGRQWRPYRFPPRSTQVAASWAGDPAAVQRAVADGFQEGIEKGYEQGLLQGQEAGLREGFEKGRAEGAHQGFDEGRAQGRAAFDEASRPLAHISDQVHRFLGDFELKRRQELLELVKKVSQQVIRCELTLNPTQLLTLVDEALASMPSTQGDIHILLNPEECARIKDIAPERAAAWRLIPDEKLALGECRVVTDQAEADIGCQQRLDSCVDTLAQHLHLSEV